MYNRYIPLSDGTYRRDRMQEQIPRKEQPRREHQPPAPPSPPPEKPDEPPKSCRQMPCPRQKQPQRQEYIRRNPQNGTSVTAFLRQLLPKDFDTGDLLVVILLLLMSADSCEDQNSALLTLALYLFM